MTRARCVHVKKKPYNPGRSRTPSPPRSSCRSSWSRRRRKLLTETEPQAGRHGPFTLERLDQTQINLSSVDDYWGEAIFGTPAMTTINHPIFKSNNDSDIKLESGELDAAQTFTSQIWKMWEEKARRSAPG